MADSGSTTGAEAAFLATSALRDGVRGHDGRR
jgi:hypothetical protein